MVLAFYRLTFFPCLSTFNLQGHYPLGAFPNLMAVVYCPSHKPYNVVIGSSHHELPAPLYWFGFLVFHVVGHGFRAFHAVG